MGLFDFVGGLFSSSNDYRANENPQLAQEQERRRQIADAIQGAQSRPDVQMGNQQDQFRQGQTQLVGQLQQQAMGQGPSVAQNAFNQANDQNIANSMAMAASSRGVNPALAQRLAMQNQAQNAQNLAGQYATARANEQMTAQNSLANVLSGARGQDITYGGQNAQLQLASQQQRDDLIQKYIAMGLSADQAQLAAAMDAQRVNAGITAANTASQNMITGGILSGLAGVGSSFFGKSPVANPTGAAPSGGSTGSTGSGAASWLI